MRSCMVETCAASYSDRCTMDPEEGRDIFLTRLAPPYCYTMKTDVFDFAIPVLLSLFVTPACFLCLSYIGGRSVCFGSRVRILSLRDALQVVCRWEGNAVRSCCIQAGT